MGSETITHKLPVIDFSMENLKPGTSCWLSTCDLVQRALEEYGCFVAAYDKVSVELHNTMLEFLQGLFDLPTEAKLQKAAHKNALGYFGPTRTLPLYEGFGLENSTTLEGAQRFINLIWPEGNDGFRETCLSYSKLISELDQMVTRMVFECYGVEKYYESHVGSMTYLMGFIKYRPPLTGDSYIGNTAHTDKSFLTTLDSNHVKGLDIEKKNGEWICYEPSSSHFVVMAGDAFTAWSNGRIHAPNHRVVMRGTEVARYSIKMNSYGREMVQTPEELVDEQHPLLFKPFSHPEFLSYCKEQAQQGHKDSTSCILKDFCGV